MRKTTINVVSGILIGIFATKVTTEIDSRPNEQNGLSPTLATTVSVPKMELSPSDFEILEVPPPLNMEGLHPFETYLNGKPIKIPYEKVRELVVTYGHTMNTPRGRTRSLNQIIEQRMTYIHEEEDINGITGK